MQFLIEQLDRNRAARLRAGIDICQRDAETVFKRSVLKGFLPVETEAVHFITQQGPGRIEQIVIPAEPLLKVIFGLNPFQPLSVLLALSFPAFLLSESTSELPLRSR